MVGKVSLRGGSLEEGVDAIATRLRELDEAYQIIKLFKQGDLSRQEAESQLLALGFGEDLIKKRLDDVSFA